MPSYSVCRLGTYYFYYLLECLSSLIHRLDAQEKVEADDGYRGEPKFVDCPSDMVDS